MAKIQLKRYNGSGWDSIQPETDWSYVLNKPSLFTPEIHSHDIDDITDLQTALDAKAPIANPTFTGRVTIATDGGVDINAGNTSLDFLRVRYNGEDTYGWKFKYTGDLSGNENGLEIWSSTNRSVRITQDGIANFDSTPKAGGTLLVKTDDSRLVSHDNVLTTANFIVGTDYMAAWDKDFADLINKPTTLAGYGITDALTETEVNQLFTDLVGAAPGTLDTLAEIADAINDDANLYTTLTSMIGGKEPAFTKNTAFNKNFGTASGTVCQGNDSRLVFDDTPVNGQTAQAITSNWAYDHTATHPAPTNRDTRNQIAGSYAASSHSHLIGDLPSDVVVDADIANMLTTAHTTNHPAPTNRDTRNQIAGSYAASSHTHGDISDDGKIISAAVAPGENDYILIKDDSASGAIKNGIRIGTGTTKYLREDGTWQTPPDNNTQLSDEAVQDIVGGMINITGAQDGMGVAYNDATNKIDIDLSHTHPAGAASGTWRKIRTRAVGGSFTEACSGTTIGYIEVEEGALSQDCILMIEVTFGLTNYQSNISQYIIINLGDHEDSSPDGNLQKSVGFMTALTTYLYFVTFSMSGYIATDPDRLYFNYGKYVTSNAITTETACGIYVGNVWILEE